jgi:2'-hydroxyisoflavone reductase
MRLLVIGGTRFVGRGVVQFALDAGHEITLFNRGQTDPGAYPETEHLVGDRDGGLDVLRDRTWDAVIDTCGYVPRVVKASAELLSGSVGHYTFVSSLSVYADDRTPGQDESAPLLRLEDPTVEEVTGESYGGLKVLCEQAVDEAFPGRALIVRCGLIVGPEDYSDRMPYWVRRVAEGGEVLAPGPRDYPVQVIDARDLGAWMVSCAEAGTVGTYNATGPVVPHTLEALFDTCRAASGSDARFTWVSPEFVAEQGVEGWTDLPLWLPLPEFGGVMTSDVRRAAAAGLRQRSLEETVRDTLAWDRERPHDEPMKAGLTREREAELLAAWHAREAMVDGGGAGG